MDDEQIGNIPVLKVIQNIRQETLLKIERENKQCNFDFKDADPNDDVDMDDLHNKKNQETKRGLQEIIKILKVILPESHFFTQANIYEKLEEQK